MDAVQLETPQVGLPTQLTVGRELGNGRRRWGLAGPHKCGEAKYALVRGGEAAGGGVLTRCPRLGEMAQGPPCPPDILSLICTVRTVLLVMTWCQAPRFCLWWGAVWIPAQGPLTIPRVVLARRLQARCLGFRALVLKLLFARSPQASLAAQMV